MADASRPHLFIVTPPPQQQWKVPASFNKYPADPHVLLQRKQRFLNMGSKKRTKHPAFLWSPANLVSMKRQQREPVREDAEPPPGLPPIPTPGHPHDHEFMDDLKDKNDYTKRVMKRTSKVCIFYYSSAVCFLDFFAHMVVAEVQRLHPAIRPVGRDTDWPSCEVLQMRS